MRLQPWRWFTRCEAVSEDGVRCDERAGHAPRSPHRAQDDLGIELSWPCGMRSFAPPEPLNVYRMTTVDPPTADSTGLRWGR